MNCVRDGFGTCGDGRERVNDDRGREAGNTTAAARSSKENEEEEYAIYYIILLFGRNGR
jgi:hypothetical protein